MIPIRELLLAGTISSAMLLQGCLTAPSLGALTSPTPDLIKARLDTLYQNTNAAVGTPISASNPAARATPMSPSEYARTGYNIVNDECNVFFDTLARVTNGNQLSKADWTALGTATGVILALAHAGSTKPVGIAAASFALGAAAYDNYQKYALLTPYPDQTKVLVGKALEAYATAAPAEKATDMVDADSRVSGYAAVCTYANVTALAQTAITTGTPSVTNSPTNSDIASVFSTTADVTNVKAIEAALSLHYISDSDLATLALLAEALPPAVSPVIPPTAYANELSQPVAAAVWDSSSAQPLPAFNTVVTNKLAALIDANPAFAKIVTDAQAASVAAAKKAAVAAAAAGTTPSAPVFIPPVKASGSFIRPSIVVNAPDSSKK